MKSTVKTILSLVVVLFSALLLFAFSWRDNVSDRISFPYKKVGLSERQAAAHLLSRFTYGARKGDVDAVVKMGLEKWFLQQLDGGLPDDSLNAELASLPNINLSNAEIDNVYPRPGAVVRKAVEEGYIDKDSVNTLDRKLYRQRLDSYMQQKGLKPQQALYRTFIEQKVLRAIHTQNQLREVMTDFWFNHFNVSITKNQCASYIPSYEREVIRPNVLGNFNTLLLATAKSPAMLIYLDNYTSKRGGLNENYAREVMELHTLGVDGGYTQLDVTEAARVLTGWTLGQGVGKGEFLFAVKRHDQKAKTVLGNRFEADGGYEEGVSLLKMLGDHPSTAKFITKKIAVRFVSDNPAQTLLNKMAKTFEASDGDIREVILAMVKSREFWTEKAIREKTKSPFELVMSAVRGLDADVRQPYQLFSWVNKMGQKIYYYQAPTGFPDKGQYWINTGALLNRMNFGIALASQKIPGVKIDLSALNGNREPESAEAALLTYGKLIMPERALGESVERLKPLLNAPELLVKMDKAAAVVGLIIGSPEFQRK